MTQIAVAESTPGPLPWRAPTRAKRATLPALAIETPRLVLRRVDDGDAGTVEMAILLKASLAEIGWIRFSLGHGAERVVELSFFLDPAHRGRALMREAARAAAARALLMLGARTIRATLPAGAEAAHEVARALGLTASSKRGTTRCFEKDLCGLI